MRKWLLALLLLLLFSCQGSSFDAVNENLKAELTYEKGEGDEVLFKRMSLCFSANLSSDGDYSLQLISPDGKLVWSSPLVLSDGVYTSSELALTEGAFFPEGEYVYSILNDKGFEITGEVSLAYDTIPSQETSYTDGFGNSYII